MLICVPQDLYSPSMSAWVSVFVRHDSSWMFFSILEFFNGSDCFDFIFFIFICFGMCLRQLLYSCLFSSEVIFAISSFEVFTGLFQFYTWHFLPVYNIIAFTCGQYKEMLVFLISTNISNFALKLVVCLCFILLVILLFY